MKKSRPFDPSASPTVALMPSDMRFVAASFSGLGKTLSHSARIEIAENLAGVSTPNQSIARLIAQARR
ncbi:MAG: hypothetical protein KDJ38_00035 [Gammaproteobacteria bacterium]|nr:hypothetical protein [Gammaproteobacteria bacterium]